MSCAAAFDRAIERIYGTVKLPDTWCDALEAIADVFDDAGALLVFSGPDGSIITIVSPRLEAAQRDYDARWWSQDIRFIRSRERGYLAAADTITDRDVVTEEEIGHHPFYVEFLRPNGLGWLAGTAIAPRTTVSGALSIQRSYRKKPYSDGELDLLARIGRHVETALRMNLDRAPEAGRADAVLHALSEIGTGLVVVDDKLGVLIANEAARHTPGLTLNGRLSVNDKDAQAALSAAVYAATRGWVEPQLIVLRAEEVVSALHILSVPRDGSFLREWFQSARAIVLIGSSRPSDAPDPVLVREP